MPNTNINRKIVLRDYYVSPLLLTWYKSLAVKPTLTLLNDLNVLVDGLYSGGNWTELDLFHVIGGLETDEQRLRPIKSSSGSDFTAVNSPTLNSNGLTGNGSSSYLNSNWNPTTHGSKFTLNSGSVGIYSRTNSTLLNGAEIGGKDAAAGSRTEIFSKYAANGQFYVNTSSFKDVAMADSLGLIAADRTGAATGSVYKNGATLDTNIAASGSVANVNFFIGAFNNNGAAAMFSSRNIAMAFVGSGAINQATFYSRIQTYMTARGLNV